MQAGDTLDMPAARPAADDDGPALEPGAALGAYRVVSLLGQGGMGRVYLAEHSVIKRRVALKVLRRSLVDSQRSVERFFAEAEAVNRIRHPGIVEVTDLFLVDATPCIVMELLDGETLASEIAKGKLAPARVVDVGRAIAAALSATHNAGVVHRDLKPDNVVITNDAASCVKILDFGVAKLLDGPTATAGQTAAGAILGTPEYMSPEQLAGKTIDARADIYTLGITLYHAATGRVPFHGESFGDYVVKHLTQEPPPLEGVPPGLARAILVMIAKEPDARPATMADVDALLAGALAWRAPHRTKPLAIAAGIAVVVIGGAWQLAVHGGVTHGAAQRLGGDVHASAATDARVATAPIAEEPVLSAIVDEDVNAKSEDAVSANTASDARPARPANGGSTASDASTENTAGKANASNANASNAGNAGNAGTTRSISKRRVPDANAKRAVIDPFGGGE